MTKNLHNHARKLLKYNKLKQNWAKSWYRGLYVSRPQNGSDLFCWCTAQRYQDCKMSTVTKQKWKCEQWMMVESSIMPHMTQSRSFERQSLDWHWQIVQENTQTDYKQHKIQHNITTLVQSPITTLGQETRQSYSKMLRRPHWAISVANCTLDVYLCCDVVRPTDFSCS